MHEFSLVLQRAPARSQAARDAVRSERPDAPQRPAAQSGVRRPGSSLSADAYHRGSAGSARALASVGGPALCALMDSDLPTSLDAAGQGSDEARASTGMPGGAAPGSPSPTGGRPPERRHARRRVLEWVVVVVCAALVAFGLRAFVVQTFFVPSGSMLPTLQIGDRMLVDKLPWVVHDIHRGDIIVFRRTPADTTTDAGDLVKRVIGLPGETISSRADVVLIDGRPLREPWLPQLVGQCAQSAFDIPRTTIPAGHYFVMGDCRGNSEDSRFWGTVPLSYVVGKVFVVIWRHGHPWLHWF